MTVSRRHFIKTAGAVSLGFGGLNLFMTGCARGGDGVDLSEWAMMPGYGPLKADPRGVFALPEGFSYQVIARQGLPMDDGLLVPGRPDGMAAFHGNAGRTIIVCNHELNTGDHAMGPYGDDMRLLNKVPANLVYDPGKEHPITGGTSTLIYNTKTQQLEKHYLSLSGTVRNCAGGPTPWNTWITCEETAVKADDAHMVDHGYNFEVDSLASGLTEPVPLYDMGRFMHEAVAVEPKSGIVYQTEDRHDGLIYRFLPNRGDDLAAGGRLQTLAIKGAPGTDTRNWEGVTIAQGEEFEVEWIDVDNVRSPEDDLRLVNFDKGAARFARGEGMWYGNDAVYFACTNGGAKKLGQIWKYLPSPKEGTPQEKDEPGKLVLFLEPNDSNLLQNADNLTVAPWGDLIVCEDGGGDDRLIGVTPQGKTYEVARNTISDSELAGVTFSPDGSTLFVNIQEQGLTLAITGPWRQMA